MIEIFANIEHVTNVLTFLIAVPALIFTAVTLRETKKQLRISGEQLQAFVEQTKAANNQLKVSSDQLRTSSDQLKISSDQLDAVERTAQAQLILMMDEMLHNYEDVRVTINNSGMPEHKIRLRRYVACIERIGIMLQLDPIRLDRINELYGHRIKKLLDNNDVYRILSKGPEGWPAVIYLWRMLHDKFPSRGFRNLPSGSKIDSRSHLVAHGEEGEKEE